jgi:hypothetical protein
MFTASISLLVNIEVSHFLRKNEIYSFGGRQNCLFLSGARNPKPLDAPQTKHDAGDLVDPCGFVGRTPQKYKVTYSGDNDGDVHNNMGRGNPHFGMARKQSTTMLMSSVDDDKKWCLKSVRCVGSVHDINNS